MLRLVRTVGFDLSALALGFVLSSFAVAVGSAARLTDTATVAAPPTVSLLSPLSGQTVAGDVVLSATTGLTTQSLQFQVGGANVGPQLTSGPCSTTWSTSGFYDGSYAVTVIAIDANGNSAAANPVTVTVENAPLSVSAVQVIAVSASSAIVTWTTNQPASSNVDYGPAAYSASQLDWRLVTSHTVTIAALSPGTSYHFRVSSSNAVGASATSVDAVFATAPSGSPTTPPEVTPAPVGSEPIPGLIQTPSSGVITTPSPAPDSKPTPTPTPTPSPTPTPTPTPSPTPTPPPTSGTSGPAFGSAIGYVLDASGQPVPNVKVQLMQGERLVGRTVTNTSGKFEFRNLAPGTYKAIASMPGGNQVMTMTVSSVAGTTGRTMAHQ
jgi:hypothetical protein